MRTANIKEAYAPQIKYRIAQVKVFPLSELSEEAKEHAHEEWLQSWDYPWTDDGRDTINALAELFGVECKDWEYGGYRSPSFNILYDNMDADVLALEGNRARAWLINNVWDCVYNKKYPTKDKRGRIVHETLRDSWNNCPLTGVCFDFDALLPLHDFILGKGDYDTRIVARDNRNTVESVIEDCFHNLLTALDADYHSCQTMEYFEDMSDANCWEYDEDGNLWTGREVA